MRDRRVFKVKGLPYFEVSHKPWFGPTRRARSMLRPTREVLGPADTLRAIGEALGSDFGAIQFARFIDFESREHGRLTIAILWTDSDPDVRDLIFSDAQQIVDATGWYPIGQGERLESVNGWTAIRHGAMPLHQSEFRLAGPMRTISPAVQPDAGCSVRVATQGGSILLDSGLPGHIRPDSSDQLLLLTHAHADHSGGWLSGGLGHLRVVASSGTAQLLLANGRLTREELRKTVSIVDPGERIRLAETIEAEAFAVPHLPGSVGYILRDENQSLFFTGDICLETARHSFTPTLVDLVRAEGRPCTVLLDATMAGRPYGATSVAVAEAALEASAGTDLVVLGNGGDRLFYAYLDLFFTLLATGQRHTRSFLASSDLRPLMRATHAAFIRSEGDRLDPFIAGQYGASRAAWGESRWLFWLDNLTTSPPGERVWLLGADELARADAPQGSRFLNLAGDDARTRAEEMEWTELTDLDTSVWTLHSNETALSRGVAALSACGARVVLFHNFSSRTNRFVKKAGLEAEALSGEMHLRLA